MTRSVAAGLGWGVGTALTLAVVGRLGGGGLRPVVKSAVRLGVGVSEWAAAAGTEMLEQAQDLYHEVLDERRIAAAARVSGNGAVAPPPVAVPGDGG